MAPNCNLRFHSDINIKTMTIFPDRGVPIPSVLAPPKTGGGGCHCDLKRHYPIPIPADVSQNIRATAVACCKRGYALSNTNYK